MKKYFRTVDEQKFYCDENGLLTKDEEGNPQEVEENDTEAVEVEDATVDEVSKMLDDALVQAKSQHEKDLAESMGKASKSIDTFFKAVSKQAEKSTKGVSEQEDEVKSSFDAKQVKAGLEDLRSGNRQSFAFQINNKADFDYLAKVAGPMGIDTNLTGDVIAPDRVAGISRDPVRSPFIENIANVTPISGETLSWTEVVAEDGSPASTAELDTIPEKDFDFQQFTTPLKKIAVMAKHSVELLSDAPQLVNAIQNMLQVDMNVEVDKQLLSGTGLTKYLKGVLTTATTFTGATSDKIANANLFDVIRLAMTEIQVAGKGKFLPTHVVLNPADAQDLDLTKNSAGDYILPPFYTAEGQSIKGARIITNTGMNAGDFLVGDFTKFHIGVKGGVEIEFTNSDGTDFAKDILTMKMRRRLASYVRANDSGAFQTGTISTVITNITPAQT